MHTALVSRLLKDRSAWELAHVPVETANSDEARAAENASRPGLSSGWYGSRWPESRSGHLGKENSHWRFSGVVLAFFGEDPCFAGCARRLLIRFES